MLWLRLAITLIIFTGVALGSGFYNGKSKVLELNPKNFRNLVYDTNYTSVVEFYAPWCGHCRSLAPHYSKVADNLHGLVKVGAVNCDEDRNKPLCAEHNIQGFPTIKIFKPPKLGATKGKKGLNRAPIIETYQGPRTAKDITHYVLGAIKNNVHRLSSLKSLVTWLQSSDSLKALYVTKKMQTGPLLKTLAIDYLGVIDFATITHKALKSIPQLQELLPKGSDESFLLVIKPGIQGVIADISGNAEALKDYIEVYTGEMSLNKTAEFLKTFAEPSNSIFAVKKASNTKSSKPGKKRNTQKGSPEERERTHDEL